MFPTCISTEQSRKCLIELWEWNSAAISDEAHHRHAWFNRWNK